MDPPLDVPKAAFQPVFARPEIGAWFAVSSIVAYFDNHGNTLPQKTPRRKDSFHISRNSRAVPKTRQRNYDIVTLCQALGDPTRYEIVSKLHRDGPTACGGFGIDCPPATLSHHFNVLRKAGFIRTEVAGNKRINVLNERVDAEFPDFLRSVLGKPKVCQPERLRQRKERNSLTDASSKPTRIGTPRVGDVLMRR